MKALISSILLWTAVVSAHSSPEGKESPETKNTDAISNRHVGKNSTDESNGNDKGSDSEEIVDPTEVGKALDDLKKTFDDSRRNGGNVTGGGQYREVRSRYDENVYQEAWDRFQRHLEKKSREHTAAQPQSGGETGNSTTKDPMTGNPASQKENWLDFYRSGLNHLKDTYPNNSKYLAQSGREHLRRRNYSAAADDLGRAVEMGDRSENTLAAYGSAAHNLGDFKLAADVSAMTLKLNPSNKSAMAVYKLSSGKESVVNLPTALPNINANAFGAASAGSGERQAVVASGGSGPAATAPRAPESTPIVQKSAALTRQAASALNVHDYSSARDYATEAVQANPQNAQAWNYRAIADNKLQYYQDAIRDASYSLNLAPGNSPALGSRAWALNKLGRYKEGLQDADSVLENNPDDPYAYQNKAFSLAGMGERAEMIESLRRSAELDPRFKSRYEKALQAPENVDVLFLFDDAPVAHGAAPAPPRGATKKRFMFLSINALLGGCLVALGMLHVLSPGWKNKVSSTVRRFVGSSALPLPSAETPVTGAGPNSAFWNQYEVVRELGSGGMGVVFEARDRALDRAVAIKKMREEIRLNPHERGRFMTEAKTVATLHHPNIVDIYSVVEDSGEVYLVFEYVAGMTLSDALRDNGPMSLADAAGILRNACSAVDYAHRHKVIHRDIKPSNIMIAEDGTAKVMDFGVAAQAKDSMTKLSMVTNTVVGTPPYMAPEQEQGNVRPESDLYSLAIVFYEMLSGELPFLGQGAGMLLNKINGKHVPISQAAKNGVPKGLDAILAKALHPDPDHRYRNAEEFISAVDALPA